MTRNRVLRPLSAAGLGLCMFAATATGWSLAASPAESNAQRITDRSAHFLLHTDLPSDEATKLLARMETTLSYTSAYWRRPTRGLIVCYVIDDLNNWPDHALPHPMARLVVDRIGGVTLINNAGAGIHSHKEVLILAAARRGVAEHEVVHAYCGLVFGSTGPAWYREGIAQVFAYTQEFGDGMRCPPELLADLTEKRAKPIKDIVKGSAFSKRLTKSLANKIDRQEKVAGLIPISDWSESDIRELDQLKKEYAWSWLACHLLHNNPNYRSRFKSLGQDLLAKRNDTFSERFGPVMDQLTFEYNFTIQHFKPGYRADLCHWDWDKRFRCMSGGRPIRTRVSAARGFQASGLQVRGGHRYHVSTSGAWRTGTEQRTTDATGDAQGRGCLEGVVMKNYSLSKPFVVCANGRFQAPYDGYLYLRCNDAWDELDDNEGSILVTLHSSRP